MEAERRLELTWDKVPRVLTGNITFPWDCSHWYVASVNGRIPMCTVTALSSHRVTHNLKYSSDLKPNIRVNGILRGSVINPYIWAN